MKSSPREHASFQTVEELGGIDLLTASYKRQNFSRHSHAGYTVGVIDQGAQRFYRTGADHIAPQHSIILVNAEQVHTGCAAATDGWSYRALYPTPEQFEQAFETEAGEKSNAPYFPQAVVEDPIMATMLRRCFNVLTHSNNALHRQSLLLGCLRQLCQRHGGQREVVLPALQHPAKLIQARDYLHQFAEQDVSLEVLANLAGMSPYHFIRQFQKHYELPPHSYQIQLRLERAKQLLRLGRSQLDCAIAVGFHDQSHLHRHFKRAMGITPGQFAKNYLKPRPKA